MLRDIDYPTNVNREERQIQMQTKLDRKKLKEQWISAYNIFRAVQKQQLKMPATDAGKTSGICNLRTWLTSLEDIIYTDASCENLNQYINGSIYRYLISQI